MFRSNYFSTLTEKEDCYHMFEGRKPFRGFVTVPEGGKDEQADWGSTTTAKAHLMCSEAFCRRVTLPALAAAEGFLLCVTELVFLQVADLEELFPAAGAPVPPLSDLGLLLSPATSAGCRGGRRARRGCGGLGGDRRFHRVWVPSDPVDASGFSRQAGTAAASRRCSADLSDLRRCSTWTVCLITWTVCLTCWTVCLTCCCARCSLRSSSSEFLCAPLLRACAGRTLLEAFPLLSASAFLSSSSPLCVLSHLF